MLFGLYKSSGTSKENLGSGGFLNDRFKTVFLFHLNLCIYNMKVVIFLYNRVVVVNENFFFLRSVLNTCEIKVHDSKDGLF